MKGNFIRTNILPSKNESEQPEKFLVQNQAKNCKFLVFFSKSALENTFHLMIFILYTHNLLKTAKKPKVM